MNHHAKKFFEDHPNAKYFYINHNSRFPNPKLFSAPEWKPDPWPTYSYWQHHNREVGDTR